MRIRGAIRLFCIQVHYRNTGRKGKARNEGGEEGRKEGENGAKKGKDGKQNEKKGQDGKKGKMGKQGRMGKRWKKEKGYKTEIKVKDVKKGGNMGKMGITLGKERIDMEKENELGIGEMRKRRTIWRKRGRR